MSEATNGKKKPHPRIPTGGADAATRKLRAEVEERFGVLPNFFRLAPDSPEITANLWGFARFAYLDNPLPSLFKERLFVHLSRFCDVRYCIARHVGFLVGLGRPAGDEKAPVQSVEEVIKLLRRPLPRGKQLAPFLARLDAAEAPLAELPGSDSALEADVFAAATHVFLHTPDAPSCLAALRRAFSGVRFQHLLVFLAFIRTAHYWTKVHAELGLEDDVRELLATHETLAELVLNDPEATACGVSQTLMDELAGLREEKQRHEELRRAHELLRENMGDALAAKEALRESEEKFRTFVSATSDVVYKMSADWCEMRSLVGKEFIATTEDPRQDWTQEYIPESDRRLVWETINRAIQTKSNFELEHRVIRLDGSIGWTFSRAIPVLDEGGEIVEWLGAAQDITERKRAEEALRESEARFRVMADSSPFIIWVTDGKGNIQFINREYQDFFGATLEQVLGRGWQPLLHPEDAPEYVSSFLKSLENQEPWIAQCRVRRHDGEWRWIESQSLPRFSETGEFLGAVGSSPDITERKRAEETLKRQKALLETLNESVLDGILIVSPEGEMLHFNQQFLDIWNFPPEIVASGSDERALEWAADQTANSAEFLARIKDVYEHPDRAVREELLMKDGRAYERFGAPIGDGDTRFGWVWTFRNITERKRTETNLAFLSDVSQLLTALADEREIMRRCAAKIGAYFDAAHCAFVEFDERAEVAMIPHDWRRDESAPSYEGAYRTADFQTAEFQATLAAGRPVIVNDVVTDARTANLDNLRRFDIGSFLNTPFVSDGRLKAAVVLYRPDAHEWAADRVELLHELTRRVWTRVEAARAAAALAKSEAEFRKLADAVPQVVWVADGAGRITYVNEQWTEFSGLDAAATATPEIVAAVIHPEDRERVFGEWARAFASGSPYQVEGRMRDHRTGEYCWFLMRSEPTRDGAGNVVQWFGTSTDITERKRQEEELETANYRFRVAEEAAKGLNYEWDVETGVVTRSETVERVLGYRREELAPTWRAWADLIHPDDAVVHSEAEAVEFMRRLGEETFGGEYRVRHKAGHWVWVMERGLVIRDEAGRARRVIGQTVDITERREFEAERERLLRQEQAARAEAERARAEAEAATRAKDDFIALVSHELRNPLNAIIGYNYLLQLGAADDAPRLRYTGMIESSARRQLRLIEDLLDTARVISGKLRLEVRPLDLARVVGDALDIVRPTAEARRIALAADLAAGPEGGGEITGDPERLQQVVWNLLSNAVKFTPEGGRVEVGLERAGAHLRLTVADTGKGIAAEALPRVFDRYHQADASSGRRQGGLGLGLALVKQLVELHGGRIEAASEGAGRGATFTVTLPARGAEGGERGEGAAVQ
jgi:PAS domain S-box-containing protein